MAVDLGKNLARDTESVYPDRHAAINRDLKENLPDFVARKSVIQRPLQMEFKFTRPVERREHG